MPDSPVAEGRLGVRLGEDPAEARAAFERCVAEACDGDPWLRAHPAAVTWPGGRFASGRLPEGHPLPEVIRGAHADAGGAAGLRECGAPYGSDLRLYAGAGIPRCSSGRGTSGWRTASGSRWRSPKWWRRRGRWR